MNPELSRIEVAIPFPVFNTFTYLVPDDMRGLVEPGKRVLVPFGNQRVAGYVLGADGRENPGELKPIADVLDDVPLFPESMIPFFRWIADYYVYPIGEVIREALPGGINPAECAVYSLPEFVDAALAGGDDKVGDLACDILKILENGPARAADIARKAGCEIPASLLARMERGGWVRKEKTLRKGRTRHKMQRFAAIADVIPTPPPEIESEKGTGFTSPFAIGDSGGFGGLENENPPRPPFSKGGGKDKATLSEPKRQILDHLAANGETAVDRLKEIVPTAAAHLRDLAKTGLIRFLEKPVYRDPFGEPVTPDTPPKLTIEQQRVVREVTLAMDGGYSAFLLAGVTGSGKTEVYMHLAAAALEKGRTVLVLVPEIALISEIERRFRARFGECVAVLHSGLSDGERHDQWMRISAGACPIAIGARSAIFAPFASPGLIIVDEEHETSYKQENRFHYNARDMAVVRAHQAGAVALLGSATPSIQSVSNVAAKKFRELNLTRRIHSSVLPHVEIVDLREYKDTRGTGRFITPALHRAMKETLSRGEQVLLFLNRRGFASHPVCASCGAPQKCKHCDITLTLHKKANIYKCHMCGYFRAAVSVCDTCGAKSIKPLGMGTEKLEAAVQALFPEARIARMDRDTTTRKGSLLKMLKDLRHRNIDILVGTQMVAKGHDFPGITLVGIICADLSLAFPDFRAGEMTFQVLAQVAGRAGRGTAPGRVILQTYSPDHFSIVAAQAQDFMSFYNQEIRYRKELDYPPFSRMIQVKISGRDLDRTRQHAETTGRLCRQIQLAEDGAGRAVEIMGPIEAPLSRIAGRYRWQILLKAPGVAPLQQFIRRLMFENGSHFNARDVHTAVDVDPFFMM